MCSVTCTNHCNNIGVILTPLSLSAQRISLIQLSSCGPVPEEIANPLIIPLKKVEVTSVMQIILSRFINQCFILQSYLVIMPKYFCYYAQVGQEGYFAQISLCRHTYT